MVVNGKTWPVLEVAPERYRFRLLNAADSRFLNLALTRGNPRGRSVGQEIPFYQIGAEQGLLPKVVRIETGFATPLPGNGLNVCPGNSGRVKGNPNNPCVQKTAAAARDQALLMGPSERADVIVDFAGLKDGDEVIMINTGPDAPFGGFPTAPADPATTGQVMKFRVNFALSNPSGVDPSTPPESLVLNNAMPGGDAPLGPPSITRDLALLEEVSSLICVDATENPPCPVSGPFGPKAAVLGFNGGTVPQVQLWADPVRQVPMLGSTEEWELWNWSVDAHPIHLHLVKFQVVRCWTN